MTYLIPLCEWEHCDGHLGKFASCHDEALYLSTLDGFDESTGSVDFQGHLTYVIVDEPQIVMMPTLLGKAPFPLRPGAYLIHSTEGGHVDVIEGDWLELRRRFDDFADAYAEWIADNDL